MTKKLIKIFSCLLLLIAVPLVSLATPYYVCVDESTCDAGAAGNTDWETGNDGNAGTSRGAPFLTIDFCADTVSAGDTCIIGDGTYIDHDDDDKVVDISVTGTAESWITFEAENTHGAVLDGENYTTEYTIRFSTDASYIKFIGLQLTKALRGYQIQGGGNHDILIEQNKIHDIGRIESDAATGYSGIYSGPGSYSITVNRNLIYDIGRLAENCGTECNGHDHGFYMRGKYHVVTNNIFYNMYSGWGVSHRGYDGVSGTGSDTYIVNNTFAVAANDGIAGHINFFTNSGDDYSATNVHIENNIFYDPPFDAVIRVSASEDPSDIYYRYNVSSASADASVHATSSITYAENSNNTRSLALANFYLTDPGNYDYSLTSVSASMINQGLATNAPADDYIGTFRPQGSTDDIGAYEFIDYGGLAIEGLDIE